MIQMRRSPFLIGIGGGTGAGKTTIANKLTEIVNVDIEVLSLDNYYHDRSHLSPEERKEVNYDHPDAIDWDQFVEDLKTLSEGEPIEMPRYDFKTHTRKSSIRVTPTSVVVIEGIFTLYNENVLEELDLSIYVQTDSDVRVLRRLHRDIMDRGRNLESVIDQYTSTVKPMHDQFVEPTKRKADVIIPEGINEPAIELLRNKINVESKYSYGDVS